MIQTDTRDRDASRHVLGAGLVLGLLAEVALNGTAPGIGVAIVVSSVLAAGWWIRRRGRALDPLDAWLPVAAVVVAMFVAIRADPFLAVLDIALATALVGASLAAMSGLAVTRRSTAVITMIALWGLGAVLLGTATAIRLVRPTRRQLPGSLPAWVGSIGRGLIIGLPLAMIFVVLFASADPIFRGRVEDILGFGVDLGDLPGRLSFALAAAWFLGGSISIAATGVPDVERASLGAAASTGRLVVGRSLGLAEALVVLILIDLVVGGFVVLQVAYLFGGLDTLQAAGIPYAEYARRGFLELVAAACLASTVVVVLEATIMDRTRSYLAAVTILITLTAVVLVSAALRLDLYQGAYGWTELRLYVLTAIVAMAVGLAMMLGLVLVRRSRWLPHALAVLGVLSIIGLNLLTPAAFVAARNVERVVDPSLVPPDGHHGLDAAYLAVLPDDAIPVLVESLDRLPDREARDVRWILEARRQLLESEDAYRSPFSWNLGRERARSALATLP
jgi:hypothetical protein